MRPHYVYTALKLYCILCKHYSMCLPYSANTDRLTVVQYNNISPNIANNFLYIHKNCKCFIDIFALEINDTVSATIYWNLFTLIGIACILFGNFNCYRHFNNQRKEYICNSVLRNKNRAKNPSTSSNLRSCTSKRPPLSLK